MDTINITIVNSCPQTDESQLQMPTRAGIVLHRLGDMSRSRGSDAKDDQSASGCVPERPRHGEHVRIVKDRFVMGRSNETKDSAIRVRMDQSGEAIKRQNREGQHGENPYTKVERGVPCLHESRETIKTRIEVEPRFPGSHESRSEDYKSNQTNRNK